MSRSKRNTPIVPVTTAKTDKPYKTTEHQRERSTTKQLLKGTADDTKLPVNKAYGDPWKGMKDGHMYIGHHQAQLEHAKLIAKGNDANDKKRVARSLKKLTAK